MTKTLYGIQAFVRRGRQLQAEPVITDENKELMERKGERLATERAGLVVYQVEVDDEIGDVDEPVILARYGDVPPAYRELPF